MNAMIHIEASWKQYLKSEFEKPYFAKLTEN
ncbi:MAG: uracil-DNA glycosylase, partial [Prevotella sp.]